MLTDIDIEMLCTAIAQMSRHEIKDQLLHFEYPLPLDFTEEYLEGLDLERLRHILLAALITAKQKPITSNISYFSE